MLIQIFTPVLKYTYMYVLSWSQVKKLNEVGRLLLTSESAYIVEYVSSPSLK